MPFSIYIFKSSDNQVLIFQILPQHQTKLRAPQEGMHIWEGALSYSCSKTLVFASEEARLLHVIP